MRVVIEMHMGPCRNAQGEPPNPLGCALLPVDEVVK